MNNSISAALTAATDINSVIALVASLEKKQTKTGRSSYVVTSKGAEIKTAFKVIDASALIISNNLDGTINPAFPEELQPRDRTRLSSKLQVSKIASDLRPAQLTDSGMSSHGAPIVGPDNVVESGNGRSMGIWRAYQQGQADAYRQYLIDHAAEFGLQASDIKGMVAPVLVRERITDVDRAQFARDSNISDLQEMAASEKAYADAQFLSESVMALFNPSDDGNLLARSNDGFIRAFLREIGDTATAGLLTTDGRPTKQLIDRIQNAIFAKAYKDERLVRLVAEEPDPEMRNILTALNTAASDFAQMQSLSGDAHHDAVSGLVDGIEGVEGLDKQAIAALQEAINLVREAKDNGQAVEEVIAQRGLFGDSTPEAEALALFIVANNRSAKRMGAAFKKLAQKINDELIHQQQALGDMFGGGEVDLRSVLTAVSDEIEAEYGEGKGLNFAMFESAPGNADPYIAGLIEKASSVAELMRIVRISGKVAANTKGSEQNFLDLGFLLRTVPGEKVKAWMNTQGYSDGVLRAMIVSAENSVFYSKALRAAVESNEPAPSLADERNIDYRVQVFQECAARGEDIDRLIMLIHGLASLMPGEFSWEELRNACRSWFTASQTIPAPDKATVAASLSKKLDKAATVGDVIKALQNAQAAGKKKMADISGVIDAGQSIAASVGLTKDLDSGLIADGYIQSLLDLKAMAQRVGSFNASELGESVDFYVGEINKVRDRPEKLKPYLKDVFNRHSGFSQDVQRLRFHIYRHVDANELTPELDDIAALFSGRVAYPRAIVDHVHGKVKAAFDVLLGGGKVSDEQAQAWSDGLAVADEVAERAGRENTECGRKGYSIRDVAARAYAITGGNISTLQTISHQCKVRAYASKSQKAIVIEGNTDPAHVLWHELGHHIEYSNPHLLERAKAFLKLKAGGRLSYTNSGSRGKAEYLVRSSLSNGYMSKIYMEGRVSATSGRVLSKAPSLNNCRSTEVFSMAMQLYADPETATKSVLNNDGLVEFFLGCMKEVQDAN
ncbi:TPA: hypothetical protein MB364_000880 [Klebsiella variicola subsp. variicola]|nr:hypothetical protein [Klebsiella variicola subsp. variicola]